MDEVPLAEPVREAIAAKNVIRYLGVTA
jgi:hypothetical protein